MTGTMHSPRQQGPGKPIRPVGGLRRVNWRKYRFGLGAGQPEQPPVKKPPKAPKPIPKKRTPLVKPSAESMALPAASFQPKLGKFGRRG